MEILGEKTSGACRVTLEHDRDRGVFSVVFRRLVDGEWIREAVREEDCGPAAFRFYCGVAGEPVPEPFSSLAQPWSRLLYPWDAQ